MSARHGEGSSTNDCLTCGKSATRSRCGLPNVTRQVGPTATTYRGKKALADLRRVCGMDFEVHSAHQFEKDIDESAEDGS